MNVMTVWRTDEPCPACGNGLTIFDGPWGLQAECRLCCHNQMLTADQMADWR